MDNETIAYDAVEDKVIGDYPADFSKLMEDIEDAGDVMELSKDYRFNENDYADLNYVGGVEIEKNNFVIDGKGHTISGSNEARIIHCIGSNITLKNIKFVDGHYDGDASNYVDTGLGGAIRGSSLTIINCTFTNNYNSAIYATGGCNVINSTFNNNFGTTGGALFFEIADCNVEDCTFNNNTATYGGAIFKSGNPHEEYVCNIKNSVFNYNNATIDGGALYSNGTNFAGPVIAAVGCNFTGNNARQNGGAGSGNCSYESCIFKRNSARQGGAVYGADVTACTFENNKADDSGGAVYADNVYYSTFIGNSANRGGAIRGSNVYNCTFIGNSANKGGAMEGEKIINCTLTNNTANESGGGIFTENGLVIQGCNFTGNVAKKGAAAYSAYSIKCTDSILLNNKADSNSFDVDDSNQDLSFKFNGNNDIMNAFSYNNGITLANVTYWNGTEVNSDDVAPNRGSNPGINVTLEIYNGSELVKKITFLTDGNGRFNYDYAGLPFGGYTYKIYHADDSYYTNIEKSGEFSNLANSTVNVDIIGNLISGAPFKVNVSGQNLTKINLTIYDEDNNVVANIIDDNPNDSGKIMNFPGLPAGQYNITVINQVNETTHASQVSKLFNVSDLVINATDAIFFIGSPMVYQAKVVDDAGNPLSKIVLTFTINNDVIYGVTDKNGIAKVHLDLEKGDYDIVISHDFALNVTAKISVLQRIVENNNLVMDYNMGSFKVRAIGDDGKPIAGDYVKMSMNGKTYNVKTNNQGYAILKITLKPNTYRITSTYKGYSVQNTIKVKPTLNAKKTFKAKKNRKLTLTATLKRSNGKAISGKKVLFKLNGKIYKATTNKKGIAKLTVKKSVVNKLKVGKKYTLKISYIKHVVNSKLIVKK